MLISQHNLPVHWGTCPIVSQALKTSSIKFFELSPGVKRPRREVDQSPPTSAEVKKNVDLYIHSPYAFMA
jgi:hypothetical protein